VEEAGVNDWFILTSIAAVTLFVLMKGMRLILKPSTPPQKTVSRAPLDGDDVVRHAKNLFLRVQRAWDARDMNTLGAVVTPSSLEELEAQAAADEDYSVTEILYVSALVISHDQNSANQAAKILFDVVLREETPPDSGDWMDLLDPTSPVDSKPPPGGGTSAGEAARDNAVRVCEIWPYRLFHQ
jgi:hypothetical protein